MLRAFRGFVEHAHMGHVGRMGPHANMVELTRSQGKARGRGPSKVDRLCTSARAAARKEGGKVEGEKRRAMRLWGGARQERERGGSAHLVAPVVLIEEPILV